MTLDEMSGQRTWRGDGQDRPDEYGHEGARRCVTGRPNPGRRRPWGLRRFSHCSGFAAYRVLVGLLLFGVMIVIPLVVIADLIRESRWAPAVAISTAHLLFVATAIRDYLRRSWSLAGQIVFGLWLLCLIVVVLL